MATVCELLNYGDLDITVEDKEGSSALLYAVMEGERRLYQRDSAEGSAVDRYI